MSSLTTVAMFGEDERNKMSFTILQQQKTLEAKQPRTWGWRFLFKVLLEVQHNQREQSKLLTDQKKLLEVQNRLLRALQPHRINDSDVAFIKQMMGEGTEVGEDGSATLTTKRTPSLSKTSPPEEQEGLQQL